jgi:trehalose-6-phosphate synthase
MQPHTALAGPPAAAPGRYGVVIVANRGPNDFVWEDGKWRTRRASGGLVSMLEPLARCPDVAWFCCVSEPPDAEHAREGLFTTTSDQADPGLHVIPVPLPSGTFHAYYGQISNEVLWMLQHGLVGPTGYAYLGPERQQAWADGYLAANATLAAAIAERVGSADAFLVQDYHLYPLPALLRAAFPGTPIPISRIFRFPNRWRFGFCPPRGAAPS